MNLDPLAIHITENSKGIVVDSNLLLLLILGSFDRTFIGKFKRLAMFTLDDFHVLQHLVSRFQTVRVTPHILTEVSNLANSIPERQKRSWSEYFRDWVRNELQEQHYPAVQLIDSEAFLRFGITDAAIVESSRDTLIVTVDYRLAGYLKSHGRKALNFNHLRNSWLEQQ